MYAPRHLRPLPRSVRALAAMGVVALLVPGVSAVSTGSARAAEGKVTICHGTTSDSNPYIVNEPDKSGDVSGHADHTGPVWNPTLKKLKVMWGDIIPPFTYDENGVTKTFPGLNWNEAGQVIWRKGCIVPKPQLALTVVKTNDADGDAAFTDSETAPAAGAAVPFRVTVTNTGPVDVVVTSLSDKVGAVTVPVTCATALVGAVLAPAGSATCAFTVTGYAPAAGTSKTNTATVGVAQVDDETNTVTGSDTSVVSTPQAPPPPPAELSVTVVKTNDADGDGTFSTTETAPTAGASVPFRAVITNTSAVTVALAGLTDAVGGAADVPVTCASALPATLAPSASATCLFALPSPAAGASVTDVVTATVADVEDTTRTASATSSSTVLTAELPPPGAPDLAIVKAGPAGPVEPGDTVTYTLTVTNNGTAAGPVVVDDALPTGTTLGSLTAVGFTCSAVGVHCVRDTDLPVGQSATVTVSLVLHASYAASTVVNTAVVGPEDATPEDNSSTVTTPVTLPTADLAVTKTGPATVRRGGVITWTITVTNTGGAGAAVVQLDDTLPAGVTPVGTPSAAGWSCTGTTSVSCTLDAVLAPSASAVLQVSGTLSTDYTADTVVNTAVVGPTDGTPDDNTATATTRVLPDEFTGGGGGGVTVDPPTGGGGGVALPTTGAPVDALVPLAGWLLAAGGGLVLAARRRRTA